MTLFDSLGVLSGYVAWLVVPVIAYARLGARGKSDARWRVVVAVLSVIAQAIVGAYLYIRPLVILATWNRAMGAPPFDQVHIYFWGARWGLVSVLFWAIFWFFVGEGWRDIEKPPRLSEYPVPGHDADAGGVRD